MCSSMSSSMVILSQMQEMNNFRQTHSTKLNQAHYYLAFEVNSQEGQNLIHIQYTSVAYYTLTIYYLSNITNIQVE